MGINVGIDLGTTFSAVARISPLDGKPEIIKNSYDATTTPSVLCFEDNGNVLYGEDAKNMQAMGDTNAVAFFKRSMGNENFTLDFNGRSYDSTAFSAILLEKLKEEAEATCGEKIDGAVITVPAYFSHKEREATMEAGKRAGLNVLAIINEPTAAAFAYGLNEKDESQTVLIYDLGGGTFDVTLARINKDEITILGSDGDHELGGKDWDDCIANYLVEAFERETGIEISADQSMIASLLVTAESTKKQLSARDSVKVPITYQGTRCFVEMTGEVFEEISEYLMSSTRTVIERLFDSVNLSWSDVDGVVLVGGSTRMRMIHKYVKDMCGKEPLSGINVDEAVALGAAIRANITSYGEVLDSIGGRKRSDGTMLSIAGAKAVTDVTAHSLGMISQSQDGNSYINSIIIKKNTAIPAANRQTFKFRTRAKDNEMEVYVLQGEYRRPLDNRVINKYVITGIKKTEPATSNIEVTYEYTENGVIRVSAMQQETGKPLKIRIEPVPEDMSWTDLSPREHMGGSGSMPEVEVLLAVDLSGSMIGQPIKKAMSAMKDFVRQMDADTTKIGLIGFADRCAVLLKPTKDYRKINREIERLESVNVGACNAGEPFSDAYGILNRSDSDIKYLIVLTDGCWSYQEKAISRAKNCHATGIEVMALGFGTADHRFLKKIASTDSFASLTDLSSLSSSFSKIAQAIGSGIAAM